MADSISMAEEAGTSPASEPHTSTNDNATITGNLASTTVDADETHDSAQATAPTTSNDTPGTIDSAQAAGTESHVADNAHIEPSSTGSEAGEEPNAVSGTEDRDNSSEEEENGSDRDEKEDLFSLASSEGSADKIRKLLSDGAADIAATNEGGETALHVAARWNNIDNVTALLEAFKAKHLNINIKDDDGWTPLYGAAPYGSKELIKLILDVKDIDLRVQIPSGETPFYRACYYGNHDAAELMLAKAKEFGYEIIDTPNNDGWTPLHTACAEGEVQTVGLLLTNNAKADKRDVMGQTPLHVASAADRDELVTFLLSKKEGHALIDLTDSNSQTALHLAAEGDNSDTVKVLVKECAQLDLPDSDGYTALHLSAREGYFDVVKALLEAKPAASVNARTEKDETALQLAGRGQEDGHFEAIKLLSSALPTQSRKNALLSFCGLEESETLDRLCEHFNWEGLELEKESIKVRAKLIWNAAHKDSHDKVQQALLVKAKPTIEFDRSQANMPLSGCELANVGALQWAAYLGDYLIVWWLLYSVHGGKEMEDDRNQALRIASWCKEQLLKSDDEKHDEKKVAPETEKTRRMSKENPTLSPRTDKILQSHLPENSSDDESAALLGPSKRGIERSGTNNSLGTSATKLLGQGKTGKPDQVKTKKSDSGKAKENAKREDYARTIDTLRDPPLLPGWSETDDLFPKPPMEEILKLQPLAEKFDATIVDFYRQKDSRVNFLRRTRSVWEVVYAEEPPKPTPPDKTRLNATPADKPLEEPSNYGPSKIMENARTKVRENGTNPWGVKQNVYTEEDLQFRWLHLPANNLEWMIDLTRRVYTERKKKREDFRQLAEFIRQSIHELPGSKPYMRPISIKEHVSLEKKSEKDDAEVESKESSGEAPEAAETSQQRKPAAGKEDAQVSQQKTETQKAPDLGYSRLALYMPYLTFAIFTRPDKKKSEEIGREKKREDRKSFDKNDQLSAAYHTEKTQNNVNKADSKSDARQDWKKLHESRTLDQFYYHSLKDTEDRDETQVVTRYIDKIDKTVWKNPFIRSEQWDILRVDQLWLWVIDEKTIISSSTNRLDQKDDPILEGIFNYLKEAKGKSKGQPPPNSVDEMSKFITTFCIDQIDKDTWNGTKEDLSARQIFANTINSAADRETELFKKFDEKISKKLQDLKDKRVKKYAKTRTTKDERGIPPPPGGRNDAAPHSWKQEHIERSLSENVAHDAPDNAQKNGKDKVKVEPERESGYLAEIGKGATKGKKQKHEKVKSEKKNETNDEGGEKSMREKFEEEIKERKKRAQEKIEEEKKKELEEIEKQKKEQEKDYESISSATKLLLEVKDIRDELNILSYLLNQQKGVWGPLLGLSVNEDGTTNMNGVSQKEVERWKGPGFALKDVEEMDKIAQRIQDSVNSVLGLEQNEANISEAEETRKQTDETIEQGRTLMVFTIITIVFLPMSFLASLFALNITVFPHNGDDLVYEPKFIFSIIFSITAIISIPTILFAGKKFFLRNWEKIGKYCIRHWQRIEDILKKIKRSMGDDSNGGGDGGGSPGGAVSSVEAKRAPEDKPIEGTSTKAKTREKPTSQPKSNEEPTITVTAPDSDKSSLQKPPSGKEISPSSSRKVDEPKLAEGDVEDPNGGGEGIWRFFTHPFSNHPGHTNRPADVEQALKK